MNVYVPPIIEKVYNIQGSTAAPGSGEYHRYRALRRRERTLAAVLEKEYKEKEEQKKFEEKKLKIQSQLNKITEKKKKRRDKKKSIKKLIKETEKNIRTSQGEKCLDGMSKHDFKQLLEETRKSKAEKVNEESDEDPSTTLKPNFNAIELNNRALKPEDETPKNERGKSSKLNELFPLVEKKPVEFDTYEDYENHLEEMKIREEISRKEREKAEVKIKEVEEVVFHEED